MRHALVFTTLATLVACNAILGINEPLDPPDDDSKAGDAGAIGTSVRITTERVTDAAFNLPYTTQFAADGGRGGPYAFTTDEADLPAGVTLAVDGRLSGTPVAEGVFEFTVMATDEKTRDFATKRFVLRVNRKRWLVYQSDEVTRGKFRLYAVDLRTPGSRYELYGSLDQLSGLLTYAFSPDGNYLAYISNADIATDFDLYVVDMRSSEPEPPTLIGVEGVASNLAWSPDSRFLAFAFTRGEEGWVVLASPSNFWSSEIVSDLRGEQYYLGWVTPDLLLHTVDAVMYADRPFVPNYEAKSFAYYGPVATPYPPLETVMFSAGAAFCFQDEFHFIDFQEGQAGVRKEFLNGRVAASQDLAHVAHHDPDTGIVSIFPGFESTAITSFPAGTRMCSSGAWSRDGGLFAAGGADDRLVTVAFDGGPNVPEAVLGSYGRVAERHAPLFSPDDTWLGFSTNQGAYVAKRTATGVGTPVPVDPEAPAYEPFAEPMIYFSPNSQYFAYADTDPTDRTARLFIADLTQDPPAGANHAPTSAGTGSWVVQFGFSRDSMDYAAIVRRDAVYSSAADLYLGEARINGDLECESDTGYCQTVLSFAFQP